MAADDHQKIIDALIEAGNSFAADMERLEKEGNEFMEAEIQGKNVPLIISIKVGNRSKSANDIVVWFHPRFEEKLILKLKTQNAQTYISSFFLSVHNEESVKMIIALLTKIHEAHYTHKGTCIKLQGEIKQELLAIPHIKETIRQCFDDNVIFFTIGTKSISTMMNKGVVERSENILEIDRVQFAKFTSVVLVLAREKRDKKKEKCSYKCIIS